MNWSARLCNDSRRKDIVHNVAEVDTANHHVTGKDMKKVLLLSMMASKNSL